MLNNLLLKYFLNRYQKKYQHFNQLSYKWNQFLNYYHQVKYSSFVNMSSESKEVKSHIERSRKLTLEDVSQEFVVKRDRFKGVTVYSQQQGQFTLEEFNNKLQKAIEKWIENGVRLAWFTVALEHSDWVPLLTKNGFVYHHAGGEGVTLYRWLSTNEPVNVPSYAHTMIGVGAVVVNPKEDKILVVQERFHVSQLPRWKLPGGYLEPGESIDTAAEREVMEETGVEARFSHLLAFRHLHQANFDCSDIYIVAALEPLSMELNACPKEILKTTWMKMDEFLMSPEVHEGNKLLGQLYRDTQNNPERQIQLKIGKHPLFDKPQWVYSLPLTNTKNSL